MIPTILVLLAIKEGMPDASDPMGYHPLERLKKETGYSGLECTMALERVIKLGYLQADLSKPDWWHRFNHKMTRAGTEFIYDAWCEFAAAQWAGDVQE